MRRLLALLVLATAGCAYVDAKTTQYVGVQRFAPTHPDKVAVLPREPGTRHERLGEVLIMASVDPAAKATEIEDKLREEAAKWGASAIYVIRDVIVDRERRLIGIAIRYQ